MLPGPDYAPRHAGLVQPLALVPSLKNKFHKASSESSALPEKCSLQEGLSQPMAGRFSCSLSLGSCHGTRPCVHVP